MPIDNSTSVNTKNKADHPGGNDVCPDQARCELLPPAARPTPGGEGRLGAVAQLGERFRGTEEVRSSSLRSSTLVSPGAMAQSGSVLPSHGRGGSSILPSSTEPPAPHAVLVSTSSSLRGRPVPASAVRAETGDMLARLKRLVELQAKVTAAIAEEEDFLHGSMGISFRAIGRARDPRVVGRPRVPSAARGNRNGLTGCSVRVSAPALGAGGWGSSPCFPTMAL
jgi:hypothetical protein